MSRVNTNITSIIAQRVLSMQNERLLTSLQRLSTGLRINNGKDDPAGLIASETLRAEQRAIQAAQTNISRAVNVVAVAESGLNEITSLLNDLEDLIDRSSNESGISDEERAANQQEIDAILSSINRIASSTELQGRKLLSGELAYNTSGVSAGNIAHLQLNSVRVPEDGSRTVAIKVVQAASLATVSYTGGAIGSTPVTIEVAGNRGTERITLASASLSGIAAAINQSKDLTGVSAHVASTVVRITSTEYGSDQYVRVRALSGTFTVAGTGNDEGADVQANINGQSVTGEGLSLSVRTTILDANITLTAAYGSVTTGGTTQFAVTGGGAQFTIAPKLDMNSLATLGLSAIDTSSLGDGNVGYLYSLASGEANAIASKNYFAAQRIVRTALSQVASLRGRLGSFEKNTLETSANSLRVQFENVAAAESVIRDTDFAQETSNLTRQQILVQSATNVLKLANAQPQMVLALLQ
ncbi:MAG: flagellin [Planctomycetota bacterium]